MLNSINNNTNLPGNLLNESQSKNNGSNSSFLDILKNNLNSTNTLIKDADKITEAFALGQVEDLHQVTIATEKANVAMNLTMSIQNKVIEAYNEIMRMQI